MKSLLLAILAVMAVVPATANAESFQVTTSQDVYSYGEFLSFTVTVPNVHRDAAVFRIIDATGSGSSDITMAITGQTTTLTAPIPFSAELFKFLGTYRIEVEYGGDTAFTTFELIDSGKVVIPFWMKDIAGLWIEGVVDDSGFFRNLVDAGTVTVDQTLGDDTSITIPSWCKTNAELWRSGGISDEEFSNGLQYLISINVIAIEG